MKSWALRPTATGFRCGQRGLAADCGERERQMTPTQALSGEANSHAERN